MSQLPITDKPRLYTVFVTGSQHGSGRHGRHRFRSALGVRDFLKYRATRWINEYLAGGDDGILYHLTGISMKEAGYGKGKNGKTVRYGWKKRSRGD